MTYMGYESPVQIPTLDLYDTRMMQMYLQEAKDQYEQGKQEMKDFMKSYGDFYSDVPGQTELYNNITIGGAKDMINQLMSNGIDPYKNPEARAAISRYIASVPTAKINELKKSAENAKEYKKNRDKLILENKFDPEQEKWRLGGDTLETWDPSKPFTETTPVPKIDINELTKPYYDQFDKSEFIKNGRPGYMIYGVSDENQNKAIDAAMEGLNNTIGYKYMQHKAQQVVNDMVNEDGSPLSEQQKTEAVNNLVRQQFKNAANQFFQTKEVQDPIQMERIKNREALNLHIQKAQYDREHNDDTGGYLHLLDQIQNGMYNLYGGRFHEKDAQTGNVRTRTFADVQQEQFKDLKDASNAKRIIESVSVDATSNGYNTFIGRAAIGKSSNVIPYEAGDLKNLKSASEILVNAVGVPDNYKPTKYGYNERGKIGSAFKHNSANGVTITAQNKIVPVLKNDGTVHIYRKVKTSRYIPHKNDDGEINYNYEAGGDMYQDTGYRIDPNTGNVIESQSLPALLNDKITTEKAFGSKNKTSTPNFND